MRKFQRILPECYGDTLLVEMLVRSKVNHRLGMGEVLKALESHFVQQVAIGIVDNDKARKPSYFKAFEKERELHHLIRMKHRARNQYLILIDPALEKFVLTAALECGTEPGQIPFSETRLKQICKSPGAANNQ